MIADNTDVVNTLKAYRRSFAEVNGLLARYKYVDEMNQTITSQAFMMPKVKFNIENNPMEQGVVQLLEIEDEIKEMIQKLKERLMLAELMIDMVKPKRAGVVLRLYYIGGLSMTGVSEKINYSRTHCWRLHQQGIDWICSNYDNIVQSASESESQQGTYRVAPTYCVKEIDGSQCDNRREVY